MAYMGLGRLKWFGKPRDITEAEKQFSKALEISASIGDVVCQVKSHSFLGACELERCKFDEALQHYCESDRLLGDHIDQCFSGIGLMRCYQGLGKTAEFDAAAQKFVDLVAKEGVPSDCEKVLQEVVGQCPTQGPSPAVKKLVELASR
jgi:hypothetical protein